MDLLGVGLFGGRLGLLFANFCSNSLSSFFSKSNGSCASRQAPGLRSDTSQGPILLRIRRSVGNPTAAVILLTWRFLPSRMVSSIHEVGMLSLSLMGGVRGQHLGSVIF